MLVTAAAGGCAVQNNSPKRIFNKLHISPIFMYIICTWVPLKRGPKQQDIAYSIPIIEAEHKSEIVFPKTPYQAGYGVSFVKNLEKIGHVMSVPHSTTLPFPAVSLAWIHMVIDVTYYLLSPILKPRMRQTRLLVFLMLTSS